MIEAEIEAGERFAFGRNWARFLASVNDARIHQAQQSLREMLAVTTLDGKRFLDVGSGSGLFSLSARLLGAEVYSFDYDPASVACARELKRRYLPSDTLWRIERGSVLDADFVGSLGQWDVVYAWGVLHHTGDMRRALANVAPRVAPGGRLFLAIYNDQGRASRLWLKTKQLYNRLPPALRWLVLLPAAVRMLAPAALRDLAIGRPFATWRNYSRLSERGMSAWSDVVDWVGGLPFEVAKPEEIFHIYRDAGFTLAELRTCAGRAACNEYLFVRP